MESNTYDIIIIGGGPAGLTAAIYTSRAFLKTLVVEGDAPGGQLVLTTDIDNFPGFSQGINGPELMIEMRKQAERFDTSFVSINAEQVSKKDDGSFEVRTTAGDLYLAKAVIISTGASAKWLGLESEQKLRGKGVSACATCDGFFFQNKAVAVIGGGDSAMEEATFLTKFASKVYIIARKDKGELKASKIMLKRAEDNPKIEFVYNFEVKNVLGTDKVAGLEIHNTVTSEIRTLSDIEGVFLAIGHKPNTDFVKDIVELDPIGYIKVSNNTKTNVDGIFVAGDVADHRYRQAVTAAGMGCMAALDAEKYLNSLNK